MRERLVDMIDAWFARVEANPNVHRLAAHHLPDDAIIAAAAATIRTMQLANDARLISSIAPHVPREEIEPLGEVVRGALLSLADWWVDHPDVSRSVPVAVMCRVCNGLLLPIAEPAVPSP